jgi:hypothetical protein
VRTLWWSCLVVLCLGVVRTVAFVIQGISVGNRATIVINAVLLPLEAAFIVVLWRLRDQMTNGQPPR